MSANESEVRRWNDDYWSTVWPRREALTSTVTPYLLRHLRPAGNESVLEIGPGAGGPSLEIAQHLPHGRLTGADLSAPLVELARRRAAAAGVTNLDFVLADVQTEAVPGAPFDAAVSQFGVMFFADPVAAFANVRGQTAPGGKLAFVCWRAAERNPWNAGAALAPFLPAGPGGAAGPPGPFSLADGAATAALLERAGWMAVECHPYERTATVGREAIFEEAELAFRGVAETDRDAAVAAVERRLAPLRRADGRYNVPLAFQVFTAVNG